MGRLSQDIDFVIQCCFDLPPLYAREPLQKLLNGGSIAQVLK